MDSTGQLVKSIPVEKRIQLTSLSFSADGSEIAVGGNFLSLWNTVTWEEKLRLRDFGGQVVLSPNGSTIVSATNEGALHIFDTLTGESQKTISGYFYDVEGLAYGIDGSELFAHYWGGEIVRYNETIPTFTGLDSNAMAVSPDASTIAYEWFGLKLRNLTTGEDTELAGSPYQITNITYSSDGRMLATGGARGQVTIWDAESGGARELGTETDWSNRVMSLAFSPDGNTLASGHSNNVVIWDVVSGQQKLEHYRTDHYHIPGTSVAFSPDNVTVAVGFNGNSLTLLNTMTGSVNDWGIYASSVAYSLDGSKIACGLSRGLVVLDAATGSVLRNFEGHENSVTSVAFSPEGDMVASGSWDGTILLWDLTSAPTPSAPPYTPPDFSGSLSLSAPDTVHSVAFSPDGATLASGNADNTVSLWWSGTGQLQRTLSGHEGKVRSVAFSPDGLTVASGSVDKTIRLWDADTGQFRRSLQHYGTVWNVSFSHDGTLLRKRRGGCARPRMGREYGAAQAYLFWSFDQGVEHGIQSRRVNACKRRTGPRYPSLGCAERRAADDTFGA